VKNPSGRHKVGYVSSGLGLKKNFVVQKEDTSQTDFAKVTMRQSYNAVLAVCLALPQAQNYLRKRRISNFRGWIGIKK